MQQYEKHCTETWYVNLTQQALRQAKIFTPAFSTNKLVHTYVDNSLSMVTMAQ